MPQKRLPLTGRQSARNGPSKMPTSLREPLLLDRNCPCSAEIHRGWPRSAGSRSTKSWPPRGVERQHICTISTQFVRPAGPCSAASAERLTSWPTRPKRTRPARSCARSSRKGAAPTWSREAELGLVLESRSLAGEHRVQRRRQARRRDRSGHLAGPSRHLRPPGRKRRGDRAHRRARANAAGRRARVSMRINPGIADRHARSRRHRARRSEVRHCCATISATPIALIDASPELRLIGLSSHIGSTQTSTGALPRRGARFSSTWSRPARRPTVRSRSSTPAAVSESTTAKAARSTPGRLRARSLAPFKRRRGSRTCGWWCEPGRSLVGPFGVLVAAVIQIARSRGRAAGGGS